MEQREQHRGPPGPPVGQGGAPAGVLVVMAAAVVAVWSSSTAASDAGTEAEDVAESLGIFVTSQLGITIDN